MRNIEYNTDFETSNNECSHEQVIHVLRTPSGKLVRNVYEWGSGLTVMLTNGDTSRIDAKLVLLNCDSDHNVVDDPKDSRYSNQYCSCPHPKAGRKVFMVNKYKHCRRHFEQDCRFFMSENDLQLTDFF